MMRLHLKRGAAIVLCLMMAVVFVPTMAFAADKQDEFIVNNVTKPSEINGELSKFSIDRGAYPEIEDGFIEPVSLTEGVIGVYATMKALYPDPDLDDGEANVKFGIFYDKVCNNPVDGVMNIDQYSSDDGDGTDYYFQIPEAGDYYLYVYALYSEDPQKDDWHGSTHIDVNMCINQYEEAKDGTVLKNDTVYGVKSQPDAKHTFKYENANTGLLTLNTDQDTHTELLQSSGELIGKEYLDDQVVSFGVKENTEHQLDVKNLSALYNAYGYYIFTESTPMVTQAGPSKAKAKTLKKGAAKNALFIAGEENPQWFKFKLTKKSKIKLKISGKTSHQLNFHFYKGKKKKEIKMLETYIADFHENRSITSSSKLSKGTYYVNITQGKLSSGSASIMWKYK